MDNPTGNRVAEVRATFDLDAAPGMAAPSRPAEVKHYRAKVFKSGNSLALRLPKALGLEAGMEMDLQPQGDGGYTLKPVEAPKRGIDVSGFAGKCPWLKPLPREDFEERPSTIAKRKAAGPE